MKRAATFYTLISLLLVFGCVTDNTRVMDEVDEGVIHSTKILFIGNSHTYYNGGLANEIQHFGAHYDISLTVSEAAQGGFTLENHFNSEATLSAINNTDWDFIILQENSSRAAYEQDEMLESMASFTTLLGTTTATVFLFQTWAYEDSPEMHSLIQESYDNASTLSGYPVVRIGNVWNQFTAQHNSPSLYDDDGIHPSVAGTYFISGFFFKKLFNYDSIVGAYGGTLTQEEANLIQEFVSATSL